MPATPLRISITSRRPTAGRPFRRKRPCWTESPTNGGTSWYCNRRRANRASIRPISPWFGRLVEIVRWCCPNAGACIAWQQTWAYARNSQHRDFGRYEKNQQLMYRGIVSSVEQLMRETSVEVVVPSGTAIQDLRNTALCDSLDLTRDGYHLNPGTGRYTAACAWFQTLVAPAFGTNVAGNGCRLAGHPSRADAPGGRSLSGGGPQSLHPAVLRLDGTCRRRGRDGSPVAVGHPAMQI
ncbi:MAG: DUF4886 domain-containing protein [Alistipes shahii]